MKKVARPKKLVLEKSCIRILTDQDLKRTTGGYDEERTSSIGSSLCNNQLH